MTVSLVSRNGIPLPLRAIPWRDLNREFWSKGKVVHPEKLERSEPLELTAFEKTVDPSRCEIHELLGMTAEQYANATPAQLTKATERMEPLSESRRAWLTIGAGVASLAPWDAYSEGSIGATIVDPEAQALLEAIVETADHIELSDPDTSITITAENDARRFGTPYELLDPITAKQIAWEQEQHGNGPVTRVSLRSNPETGNLALATDRKLMPDEFLRLARNVKRTLATAFGAVSTLDDLHARVDLIRDATESSGITIDTTSADPDEERARFLAPADPEWHSAYERVHRMVAILSDDWSLKRCPRRTCTIMEEHEHVRFAQPVHRRPQNIGSADEFWHRRIFDPTTFELGTDGLYDPLVDQFQR